jgi:hypothetical protein
MNTGLYADQTKQYIGFHLATTSAARGDCPTPIEADDR